MKHMIVLFLVFAGCLLPGCCTVFRGSHQDVEINTSPPGARATIGTQTCVTPCSLTVSRHAKKIMIDRGDTEKVYKLEKSVNFFSYYIGNILWLIVPGMIVDSSTGAKYSIDPVFIQLNNGQT